MTKKIKKPNNNIRSPWLGSVNTSGGSNNTTFDQSGNPVLPEPQFIGAMPQQLAAFDDDVNTAGKIATGAPTYGYHYQADLGLRFRGMDAVIVNPQFVNERNYFRNDADSAYRQAANKTTRDPRITDHKNINDMYQGVVKGAQVLSKYFNKPFTVMSNQIYPKINKNSLLVNIGDNETGRRAAASAEGYIYPPNSWRNITNTNLAKQDFNVRGSDYLAQMDKNYSDGSVSALNSDNWARTFMHEFGHNLGAAHAHNVFGGSSKNSIMSYDSPDDHTKLLPADINSLRNTMGYNATPQSIKQAVDRFERTGTINSRHHSHNEEGESVVFNAPIKTKKNKNNARRK